MFNTHGEELSMKSLAELTYLDMCVKESLRIFPTIPVVARDIKTELVLGTV